MKDLLYLPKLIIIFLLIPVDSDIQGANSFIIKKNCTNKSIQAEKQITSKIHHEGNDVISYISSPIHKINKVLKVKLRRQLNEFSNNLYGNAETNQIENLSKSDTKKGFKTGIFMSVLEAYIEV